MTRGTTVWTDPRGITAVEYGIVAAFLCLSLLAVFSRFGSVLTAMFASTTNGI